ncbi:MAG TPA: dynamin family protein [Saprospiraceae bacterium]|jgi:ribosome biogenesis GTPase A|nr:dynamin family protein [Saprospiraceae bacterium]HMT51844.1 dynamin family protein [Saprospiraceae bacterium]HMT68612.1 dynamin family protein [Saprospiraceae bacterium]HQV96051.1 dynamin family protein [Saprospiraceae bacterium]
MQSNHSDFNHKLSKLAISTDKLLDITREIGHEKLELTLVELRDQLEAPFTFVIVGEVKAGKSSFINALLDTDKEICKVAPMPMTDTIQQILYGETERIEEINPYLKKIYQPVEILKEIAIVDTPGTNTIVAHHQEITERFIPYSDLIVFVFEAKNPYRQSSWEFFDYINAEWHRKIVFVLQQKDLLPEADLKINFDGVVEHAKKKGISDPKVFAVSAKLEQADFHDISGFKEIRSYIENNITGGKAPELKFQNNVHTLLTISAKLDDSMKNRISQYDADVKFREEIKELIQTQHLKTTKQIEVLSDNLLDSYDNITRQKLDDLEDGLSFMSVVKRSFSSIFGKESSLKEWLTTQAKDFELKLNTSLRDKLQNGIIDVAENIQIMGKLVDNKLRYSTTILKNNDEIFADIAERRINVLKDLQQSFNQFMNTAENFYDERMVSESSKMTPNLAAGGGVAIVGVILAAVAQGAVFDITGGVLTAVGVLFAGVTLGLNRSKVIGKFEEEIIKGRSKMKQEVAEKLDDYTSRIRQKIESNFFEFDQLLEKEGMTIMRVNKVQAEIRDELSTMKANS